MKKKFLAVYEVGENNLSGFLPDVPGVVSTAPNLEAMRHAMREALEFHLEGLAADGDPIPEPATTSVDFAEEDPEHGVLLHRGMAGSESSAISIGGVKSRSLDSD
jgi:predicted RNase H-like HicB family nuclease